MLTQGWVNGIAVAVVAAGLVNAWRAIRTSAKRARNKSSAKAVAPPAKQKIFTKKMDAHGKVRWTLLRNEEEIARRHAHSADESAPPENQSSSG